MCLVPLVPINCRLRHIGWEKRGHGLTSRPRESASEAFLDELLILLRFPPRSCHALFAGTLPLRYCTIRFACRIPTWRLSVSGHAASQVTADLGVTNGNGVEVGDEEVHWVSGSGPGRKRIRLNRKPCTPRGFSCSTSATCVEEVTSFGHSVVSHADCKRRRNDQHDGYVPVQPTSPGMHA